MHPSLLVIYALIISVAATTPILLSECGSLEIPYTTYQLANNIAIRDPGDYGFACFDITGNGITLDGNGFELSSASNKLLSATGVRYSGDSATVKNLRITNLRTGIRANAMFGEVYDNTITRAINGIDVTAAYNRISHNTIGNFDASESTSGIYVYFPATTPVDSYINITNNVISDIRGDSFALGISVYYATSVYIANNQIFNLQGGVLSEEISIINGKANIHSNTFSPTEGHLPSITALLLSGLSLMLSLLYFRSSPRSRIAPNSEAQIPVEPSEQLQPEQVVQQPTEHVQLTDNIQSIENVQTDNIQSTDNVQPTDNALSTDSAQPTDDAQSTENEVQDKSKEEEEEELVVDGADFVRRKTKSRLSCSIDSSPGMG